MNKHLLSRRQFTAQCAAFGLSLPAVSAMAALQASDRVLAPVATAKAAGRTVTFPDGSSVPALGQGCWHLGQGRHPQAVEEEALRTGISLGMTLIDTSGKLRQRSLRAIHQSRDHRSTRPHIPGLQGGGR